MERILDLEGNPTRDELIRAIGRSIRNINKDGLADGVRRLPNIWQSVINKGATILKVFKCCTPVYKTMLKISNCRHLFSSNPCTNKGTKGDWDFRISDLVKNPVVNFGEVRRVHLQAVAPGIFSDLLRSVQMLKREWGAESYRKPPHLFIRSKL